MVTIQVPYHYIDTLYAIGIVGLFVFCSLCLKIFQLKREIKKLRTICSNQQEYLSRMSPNKNISYFGVDILKISLSEKLKHVSNELMPMFSELRTKLSFNLGYVIPNVRVFDDKALSDDEYQIFVRGNVVGTFKADKKENCASEIINNLENVCIEHVAKIFMQENVKNLIDRVKNKEIVENIKQNLSVEDVRLILIELIKQSISIKDIEYIIEKISAYSSKSTLNEIIDAIKADLK